MTITKQQRNFYIGCAVVFVVWYVVHSINNAMQQAAYYRQQAIRAAQQKAKAEAQAKAKAQKDAAARATPAPPKPPARPPAVVLTTLSNLAGVWKGQGALSGHGICTLRLELRPATGTPDTYAGYLTLGCRTAPGLMSPKLRANPALRLQNRMNPAASILTGTPENGSLRFHVDKTVGADVDGCAATSFTATPFGTNKIAVQWQEGACQGGEILLGKSDR